MIPIAPDITAAMRLTDNSLRSSTFLNPKVEDRRLLSVSRMAAVISGAMGIMLAVLLPSVIAAVKIFYGLLAVSLFAPVVLGLYWKGATSRAALASIAGAVGVTLAVSQFTRGEGVWLLSPQAIGIGAAFVILVVTSKIFSTANERE